MSKTSRMITVYLLCLSGSVISGIFVAPCIAAFFSGALLGAIITRNILWPDAKEEMRKS